jgi:hypothetical protein
MPLIAIDDHIATRPQGVDAGAVLQTASLRD